MDLKYRRATSNDLRDIVSLLIQDKLGQTRESFSETLDPSYIEAFHNIDKDPNQYLMVVENEGRVVGTCHLTLIPSLTFAGSTRLQIEAVRVHPDCRGQRIGDYMIKEAIKYGQSHNAKIFQLTTNKQRPEALKFYERLGFKSTHEGMKLYL